MTRFVLALFAVVVALFAGVYIGANPSTPVVGDLHDIFVNNTATVSTNRVQQLIEDDYIKKVPQSTLTSGSINGMVQSLHDPFTHYFDPKQNQEFEQEISGTYPGLGMTVSQNKQGLRVAGTFLGSPARKAGLKKGDLIVAVNGTSIAGKSADISIAKIKGPSGTFVKITVRSPLDAKGKTLGKPRVLNVERKQVETPITTGKLFKRYGRKIGVVQLASFAATSGAAVHSQVARLKKEGADSFILDLRGNPGGQVDQAQAIVSEFVNKGMIVATSGRARARQQLNAIPEDFLTTAPLVVLVDRNSASASEITAGSLKYSDRALIVGENTYGKGVFGELTNLKNGGSISLIVGRYVLPGNHYITKKGLTPDLRAVDNPKTRPDEALNAAFKALAAFKKTK